MTAPASLFDWHPEGIDADFTAFHAANPHVYELLVRFARTAVQHGKKKIGIKALYERARWEVWLATSTDDDDWRLNNSYTSRYARLIMAQEPDLAGVFETRKLRAV